MANFANTFFYHKPILDASAYRNAWRIFSRTYRIYHMQTEKKILKV